MPRSLILEPTRELALQVAENFVQYGKYLKLTHALIIGGESMSDQKDVLNRGVDVLIATPGRLLDMFDRGTILMSDTSILVIDEADRMLDMGFIPDVERIVSLLPANRQTLFFSATMGPEIKRLADAFLRNPKEVTVSRAATVATTITEGLALVAEHDKREALRRLIRTQNVQNALIFCNRKVDVDILYKSLTKHRFSAGALHGDMSQTIRFQTLGEIQVRRTAAAGVQRRCRARPRHRRAVACVQLRRADPCRGLRPPHRAHRPCRARGSTHLPSPRRTTGSPWRRSRS